jgi:DnaJ-class molecular chaperone
MIDEPSLIDFLMVSLNQMDKSLQLNDMNATLRKVHECIARIKSIKAEGELNKMIEDNKEICSACDGKGFIKIIVPNNLGTETDMKLECSSCDNKGRLEL